MFRSRRFSLILVAAGLVITIIAGGLYANYKRHQLRRLAYSANSLGLRVSSLETAMARQEPTQVRLREELDRLSTAAAQANGATNRLENKIAELGAAVAQANGVTNRLENKIAELGAAVAQANGLTTGVEQKIAQLSAAVAQANELAKEQAAQRGSESSRAYLLMAGRTDSDLELFGRVSPFDRNGLLEVYGGSLREPRRGPIGLVETVMEITHDRAWVIWSPDFSPTADASMLTVDLLETPRAGALEIGLIMSDGKTFVFDHNFGPALPAAANVVPPLVPEKFVEAAKNPVSRIALVRVGRSLRAVLPDAVLASIEANPDTAIRHWYVRVNGAAGSSVHFRRIALVEPGIDEASGKAVSLSGAVRGAALAPGSTVRLLTERGERREQAVQADGSFRFDDVERDTPISLSLSEGEMRYFSSLGRWFVPSVTRQDLTIDLRPRYVNKDGHHPDPKGAKFLTPRAPLGTGALYEMHARQVWPGSSASVQQFDSTTFTNNMGYIDRDRFFDNPRHCLRIVHLGSSHAVALQVRPFEKYNILMEEELGVALGRCVEVISAGRDNGDIGANYPSIRDYAVRFHPDAIVIDCSSSLIFQLQPQMLVQGFGWDYEHSGTGNFVKDAWGELDWRPPATDYGLHATQPTFPELVKGVPFFSSLSIPERFFPTEAKDAFSRLAMIVRWLQKTYPSERFVLQTGVDQAQCQGNCDSKATIDGEAVDMGASVFRANFNAFCAKNDFQCINPPVPDGYQSPETSLIVAGDGHYSARGHQWFADNLSAALLKMLPDLPPHQAAQR